MHGGESVFPGNVIVCGTNFGRAQKQYIVDRIDKLVAQRIGDVSIENSKALQKVNGTDRKFTNYK
jgi:hypothetical protein